MIDFEKAFEVTSNVLNGLLDAFAFVFLVLLLFREYLGAPDLSSWKFLQIGFSIGSIYMMKRLFEVYPKMVEMLRYNAFKFSFLGSVFLDVAREEGIVQTFLTLGPGMIVFDVTHELSKEVDLEDE